jgi:cytochrome c oxidase subunit 1
MGQSRAVEAPTSVEPAARRLDYLNVETTARSWLLTTDHKRIGVMFLVVLVGMLFLGGVFAMLLRLELLTPGPTIVNAMDYNRLFTLHGVTMVWLFLIPSIPTSFGNFLLPIMVGAKDVAFPRLNLASFYIYVIGSVITLWGMIQGGADTGWTFYTPYSTSTITKVVPIALGVFIVGFSTILTGMNFIVTIHTLRAKGLTWFRLPLFVWALYGTSVIQVLATPVLALVLLLVGLEHLWGLGIFDPARGGDPLLFQHLFWFYSHPAVYIMILPGMGVISECVSAFSRKNPFGYKAIAYATFGLAFVGFVTWGHHMFVAGMATFDVGTFSVLSMLVGIFTAVKVFNWVGTMYKGSIAFTAPFVYVCGFIYFLVFGGMTGVAVATASLDVHWHDTYFVVAHFHFIMVGATLMAFLAALHYWFPKMFGKMYPERWALAASIGIIFAFNATFIPQFLLGNYGMPRRYYSYPERYALLHVASTAGASILAFGFSLVFIYLVYALRSGRYSGDNPWKSRGFEWRTPSPPPEHNFLEPPTYDHGPHDYYEAGLAAARAHGARDAR